MFQCLDVVAISFNPTLVRLRPLRALRLPRCGAQFQSHAGSIEAVLIYTLHGLEDAFQSHAGSIEALARAIGLEF